MEETQVANTQGEGTPVQESTPAPTTAVTPTDSGAVAKEPQVEVTDRLDKNPRFQEVLRKNKENERKVRDYEAMLKKQELSKAQATPAENDPYAGLAPEEKEQTRQFIDRFILPEVSKRYEPFVREVQTERLNKQINEAKEFAGKFGIDFDEKLPEVVDYLSQEGNRGRLTAKEAIQNLYLNDIVNTVKSKTAEEISREKEVLMEKKKQANMTHTTVAQPSVVQSDEMALQGKSFSEKLHHNIKKAMDAHAQGYQNPKASKV